MLEESRVRGLYGPMMQSQGQAGLAAGRLAQAVLLLQTYVWNILVCRTHVDDSWLPCPQSCIMLRQFLEAQLEHPRHMEAIIEVYMS